MNPTDLQSVLSAVLREQEQRFVQLLDALRVGHSTSAAVAPPTQRNSPLPQLSDIESFVVDVVNPTHFDDWLRRFKVPLLCAAPNISEKEKTMVLANKLSTDAFAEFRKCCLPKDVTDYSYEEAVARLRPLFSKQRSVFADRYDCMRLTRDEGEEFMHVVNRCKAALKMFKFEELTKEQFDALILLSALKSPADEPLRARILQKLNQDGDRVRFDDIITDCVDFLTTKADCRVFANENFRLNAVQKLPQKRRQRRKHPPFEKHQPSKPTAQKDSTSPCFRCGDLHWCKDCPHLKHQCNECKRTGHLERQCDHIHNHRSNLKHSKVGFTQIGTVRQSPKSNGLVKMEIGVNGVQVQF